MRTGALAQTQTYEYDNMDRLKSVCFQADTCPGASDPFIRWSYDGVGNRLTETRPTATTSYTYNAADELTQAGSTSYTYDQNGNELSAGSRTFTYDLANRLKTTTLGSTTTTYTYDGEGKRLQASTGTQASKKTNFLWDVSRALPQIALERDGNNSPIRTYRYGARRISQTAGSSTSYFLHDGLGSAANLTSSTGATQWTWSYEPYGSLRTETKASGNQPDNLMKFTGEYLDPTGLYHLRARQYDPGAGRFLSIDPESAPVTAPLLSTYLYANANPTRFLDPSGRSIECVLHPIRCVEDSALVAEFRERYNRAVTSAHGVSPPPPPVEKPGPCEPKIEKGVGATLVVGGVVMIGVSVVIFRRIPPPGSAGSGLGGLAEASDLFVAGRLVPSLGGGTGALVGGVGLWCLSR